MVAPGYSLAPGATYPTPLRQLTALRAWLEGDPGGLPVDTGRLFLAGDSAGAQLAAQLALLGSNEDYAASVGIPGAWARGGIRGVLLNCGVFDLPALVRRDRGRSRILAWGTGTAAVAYAGTRDPDSPRLAQMSPVQHVDADFPPTWISGGNADPLTAGHSKPLAERLRALGVPVTALFWPDAHEPALEHEYQFNLDGEEGRQAFGSMVAFLREWQ